MPDLSVASAVEALKKLEATSAAYDHVLGVLSLDASTAAPKGSYPGRSLTTGVMSGLHYQLISDERNGQLYEYLSAHADELDEQTRREVEVGKKNYDKMHRIPMEEYVAFRTLLSEAQAVWEKAKLENDFAAFAPYLEKIVDYNRKFAGYYNPHMAPYDALLNEYEEGMNTATLDAFFAQLRETIVPLLAKIQSAPQPDDSFLRVLCPVEGQRLLSGQIMEVMGLDRNYCGIAETEHPFTTNFNNHDVRITTHYYPEAVASSLFSVIHEGGHAIYELGCDDRYNGTFLYGGVSMGIHESQSRFFENIVGRSREFVENVIFPRVKAIFPAQFESVSPLDFYRAINRVQPSLIRTEADELTYCLHIMVRYEIEKQLIDGSLAVADVPGKWNALYREYLGVDVPDDAHGCLQDVHWAGGSIGYFPSYALGSAYGPQFLHEMEKDLGDIAPDLRAGDLTRIKGWLRENIHRHASFYKPGQLFERVCGKFDARYYTDYLTKKYTALYLE